MKNIYPTSVGLIIFITYNCKERKEHYTFRINSQNLTALYDSSFLHVPIRLFFE